MSQEKLAAISSIFWAEAIQQIVYGAELRTIWQDHELDMIVADYFATLAEALSGVLA